LSDPGFQKALKMLVEALMTIVSSVFEALKPLLPLLIPLLILFAKVIAIIAKVVAGLISGLFRMIGGILNAIINAINFVIPGTKWDLKPVSLAQQGIVERTGIAKVHAGEAVVKKELISEIVNDMVIYNTFNGGYDEMERMRYEDSVRNVYGRRSR